MAARAYWTAFKTTLQTRFEYRADLALGLLGAFGWQAAGLSMLWVVLHAQSGLLAGWAPMEIGLIFGLTAMIQGTSEMFFNHIWWTPVYVVRGQFDRLLTYPVRPLPFFLVTCPELHAIGNLAGGLALFCYCAQAVGVHPSFLLLAPWWVLCGSFIHTAFLVMAGSMVLRVKGNSYQFLWLTNAILQSSRYPLGVYPGWLQGFLLFIVPFGTVNFLPASALTGRQPLWLALLAPGLAALGLAWLAWALWEQAFKGYESTGS
jgi:ABC-2 type transport system permease protein